MKKIFLFMAAGVMSASMAVAAPVDNDAAVKAALDRLSQGASADAPHWRSSLGEIEQTTAVLVESNRKLTAEYQELSSKLSAAEEAIAAQRQKNSTLEAAIAQRREVINSPDPATLEKKRLSLQSQDVQQAQAELTAAQARLKAVDNKLGLRRLKIKELEVEKQSLMMDRNARTGSTLGILRQSVASLKEQASFQKGQIEFVRKKIADLKSVDRPFLKEAGVLVADNTKLKSELQTLTAQREDLLKQVDAAVENKNKVGSSANVRRLQSLVVKKTDLEARIADAKTKKDKLAADAAANAVDAEALAKQIKELEDENTKIEEQTGNVRENIAVLEYRMNTLTRYKNRNNNRN